VVLEISQLEFFDSHSWRVSKRLFIIFIIIYHTAKERQWANLRNGSADTDLWKQLRKRYAGNQALYTVTRPIIRNFTLNIWEDAIVSEISVSVGYMYILSVYMFYVFMLSLWHKRPTRLKRNYKCLTSLYLYE